MLIKENLSFYPGKYWNGGTLQNFQRDEKVVITTEFYVQEKQYIKQIRHNKVGIPVGCVPTAAVAATRCQYWGVSIRQTTPPPLADPVRRQTSPSRQTPNSLSCRARGAEEN